jgi:tetratricopeptide (TPR) repeat protein
MIDWLRLLLMMFYAPGHALGEVRDRAPLGPAIVFALVTQIGYVLTSYFLSRSGALGPRSTFALVGTFSQSINSLFLVAIIFIPLTALVANLFERRGSFGLVLQQEYATLASSLFYALAAANLSAIVLSYLAHVSGLQDSYVASQMAVSGQVQEQLQEWFKMPPDVRAQLAADMSDPRMYARNLFLTFKLIPFAVWTVISIREVFRLNVWRSLVVMLLSVFVMLITARLWTALFSSLLASPFWLLILFFLLRGYVGEVTRAHRARASFKQNLEAATLNPADASAHYNLGLIHQQRHELDQARTRFERAVEIDADEIDAHYQLGRIARSEGRLTDAIKHFEQVVSRNRAHSLHEIWREIGATYIAARQFEDAREALESFLEHRQLDPEGLYLMGLAHAGLGHMREAASAMQACIEAVKTAPAYKYRTEKRWLNEAQQFLRSQAM